MRWRSLLTETGAHKYIWPLGPGPESRCEALTPLFAACQPEGSRPSPSSSRAPSDILARAGWRAASKPPACSSGATHAIARARARLLAHSLACAQYVCEWPRFEAIGQPSRRRRNYPITHLSQLPLASSRSPPANLRRGSTASGSPHSLRASARPTHARRRHQSGRPALSLSPSSSSSSLLAGWLAYASHSFTNPQFIHNFSPIVVVLPNGTFA